MKLCMFVDSFFAVFPTYCGNLAGLVSSYTHFWMAQARSRTPANKLDENFVMCFFQLYEARTKIMPLPEHEPVHS